MVLPVEKDARFPGASLRPLEACKYDWIVYRRIVRIKLFISIHSLDECPEINLSENEEAHTVLDEAPSCEKHLVSQMAACRQCSR
jgi:hypothetical protein